METLTLVLTDVEGSTRLWAEEPDAMDAAMRRHHEIVHAAIAESGGFRPPDQGEGDAVFGAFASPAAAVAAVADLQRGLYEEHWPTSRPLRVRVGVHVGEVRVREGNLFGDPVNRCARIRGLGSGGQSLLSSAVYELVRDRLPSGALVRDLGEHRMKDLVRAERVFQLEVAGLPQQFPPLSSLDLTSHNLPVQPTPFIGREQELAEVLVALREQRLVTLTAFGGMGKTRLALQVAAELAGDPGIGDVWFVDLAAVTDPALVPARIAEAAGIRYDGDPLGAVVAAYGARPMLLVLDNLEQVLGCATLVTELLARAPGVRVLGTSREALSVRAERIIPLPPLSLPEPGARLDTEESLSTYEAVRFFLDRAHAVRPDFTVTDANAPAVAAICARLEGSPLALELAAYRLKALDVEALLQRLEAALQVLTSGSRDMPPRHQTLRATIAWSYDTLTDDQRTLLTRLSVLPAPADLEMVEAVCGGDRDVLSTLEDLVDRNLVRIVDTAEGYRYGLLVAIRDYAFERLSITVAQHLRDLHADHVRAVLLAAAANPGFGAGRLVAALLPHVRAALDHLRATPDQRFVDLVTALDDGLIHLGLVREYQRALDLALELATRPEQLAMLHACGAMMGGRAPEAAEHGRLAVQAAVTSGNSSLIAMASVNALSSASRVIELDALLATYEGVRLELPDATRTCWDEERTHVMGLLLRYADPARAERTIRQGMKESEDPALRFDLARILLDQGRIDDAAQALAGLTSESMDFGTAWEHRSATLLGRLALLQGELVKARTLIEPACEWFLSVNAPAPVATLALIDLERAQDDPSAALKAADRALGGHGELDELIAGSIRWRRGRALLELGRPDAAGEDLAVARSLFHKDELHGPLELLDCLAVQALLIVHEDPAGASRLLTTIATRRHAWILPHFTDRDVATVETTLQTST